MPIKVFDTQLKQDQTGRIPFYGKHQSSFDQYTTQPASAGEPWASNWAALNDNFDYMQVYHGYWKSNGRSQDYARGMVYKDAYAIKTDHTDYLTQQPYILKDDATNSQNLWIPWGNPVDQYAGDIGDPAYRANWIADLALRFSEADYPGVWVDDVNVGKATADEWQVSDINKNFVAPRNPRTGLEYTLTEWRDDMATFMEEIRAAFPGKIIIHNVLFYANGWQTDADIRRIIKASDYQNLERGISDAGLVGDTGDVRYRVTTYLDFIDYVHAAGRSVIQMNYSSQHDGGPQEILREYELAGYLLARERHDLFSQDYVEWTGPDKWWQGWERSPGHALGPRYTDPDSGLLRRDYSDAIVVLNLPSESDKTLWVNDRSFVVPAKRGLVISR